MNQEKDPHWTTCAGSLILDLTALRTWEINSCCLHVTLSVCFLLATPVDKGRWEVTLLALSHTGHQWCIWDPEAVGRSHHNTDQCIWWEPRGWVKIFRSIQAPTSTLHKVFNHRSYRRADWQRRRAFVSHLKDGKNQNLKGWRWWEFDGAEDRVRFSWVWGGVCRA